MVFLFMQRNITKLITILLLILSFNANAFWIIINEELKEKEEISDRQLLMIFSLKKTQWEDGKSIVVISYGSNNKIHQDFVKDILGINHEVLENIWNIKIYSGQVQPPKIAKTKEEVIEYVKKHKGAIGYIYDNSIPGVYTFKLNGK